MIQTVGDALLADIIAHPKDDGLRLVYVDWLEDAGELERAEFIRVQVELARWEPPYSPWCNKCGWVYEQCPCEDKSGHPPELRRHEELWKREKALLDAHAHEWLFALPPGCRPILPNAIQDTFTRGFISRVSLPQDAWLEYGPAIVRQHPIEWVELCDRRATDGEAFYAWNKEPGVYASNWRTLDPRLFAWLALGKLGTLEVTTYADQTNQFLVSRIYHTEQAANQDLSSACLLYAWNTE